MLCGIGVIGSFSSIFYVFYVCILPFLEGLKQSNTWTAILANVDGHVTPWQFAFAGTPHIKIFFVLT